jgi:hypothetical protein
MIPFVILLRQQLWVCMGGVLIEVDSTVGELAEGSLLLDLGSLDGVL